MQRLPSVLILLAAMAAFPASAGVVMKMATKDASGNPLSVNTISAETDRVRVDDVGSDGGSMSTLFLGDRLVLLDHMKKEYVVLDKKTIKTLSSGLRLGSQRMAEPTPEYDPAGTNQRPIGGQTAAEQDQLRRQREAFMGRTARLGESGIEEEKLDPVSEALAQQMMNGRGSLLTASGSPKGERVRIESGETSTRGTYTCRAHSVYVGPKLSEEICAAPMDQLEGAAELSDTFLAMSKFMTKMSKSFDSGSLAAAGRSPMALVKQLGGLPVHIVHYEGGRRARETVLNSSAPATLDAQIFEIPDGYVFRDLLNPGR